MNIISPTCFLNHMSRTQARSIHKVHEMEYISKYIKVAKSRITYYIVAAIFKAY